MSRRSRGAIALPLLTTVWLSKVTEAQSPLLLLFKGYWGQSVGLLAILAIGLAAQWP